jgi:hypothetical protein
VDFSKCTTESHIKKCHKRSMRKTLPLSAIR